MTVSALSPQAAHRAVAVSFTGGKDSTLVLHLLSSSVPLPCLAVTSGRKVPFKDTQLVCTVPDGIGAGAGIGANCGLELTHEGTSEVQDRVTACGQCDVKLLVTFVPAGGKPFKAHPMELITAQAQSLGLTHIVKEVTAPYQESYTEAIKSLRLEYGIEALATGDILDVCNGFMGRACIGTGVELLTPLWDIDRKLLLALLWHYQLTAIVSCVNTAKFRPQNISTPGSGAENATSACKLAARSGKNSVEEASSTAVAFHPASAVRGGAAAGARSIEASILSATASKQAPEQQQQKHEPAKAGAVADAGSDIDVSSAASTQAGPAEEADAARAAAGVGTVDSHSRRATEAAAAQPNDTPAASPPPPAAALELLGQHLTPSLLSALLEPASNELGVDLGGEGGEYHTMVVAGGLFKQRVRFELAAGGDGKRVEGDYAFIAVERVWLEEA